MATSPTWGVPGIASPGDASPSYSAPLSTTPTGSFTLDAVVRAPRSGSFTLDAWITAPGASAFTLDAAVIVTKVGSFTLDAIIIRPASGSVTLDARVSGFTLSAWVYGTLGLTLDAIVLRQSGAPAANPDARGIPAIAIPGAASPAYSLSGGPLGFTVDAMVSVPRSGSFTFDATIVRQITLNAIVRSPSRVVATGSNGRLGEDVLGSFRLGGGSPSSIVGDYGLSIQSSIHATPVSSFTLDAAHSVPASGSFTLDAAITFHTEGILLFQSVVLGSGAGSFTLDATIIGLAFFDDFERTVVQGLGRTWTWSQDDSWPATSPDTAIASVDGHEAVVPNGSGAQYESYVGIPDVSVAGGVLQFDFWVPANVDDGYADYGVQQLQNYLYAYSSGSSGQWYAYTRWSSTLFSPVASTWYTVKAQLGATDRIKVWKRGDPEPDWMGSGTAGTPYLNNHPYLDFYYTPYAEAARLDNLALYSVSGWTFYGAFWLQASIVGIPGFTLDAVIARGAISFDATVAPYVTLRAWISSPTGSIFTLHAWIERWFTLDAEIIWRWYGSFTFDAVIRLPGTFTLDAVTEAFGIRGYFDLDAYVDGRRAGSFTLYAWVVGTPGSFTFDAQVSVPSTGSGSFAVDATISNTIHVLAFPLDAWVLVGQEGAFTLGAFVGQTKLRAFTLDALVAGHLTFDAWIIRRAFSMDAWVAGHLTLDAITFTTDQLSFSIDAVVGQHGIVAPTVPSWGVPAMAVPGAASPAYSSFSTLIPIYYWNLDAVVIAPIASSFTLDAWVIGSGFAPAKGTLTLDAYVFLAGYGTFSLNAVIPGSSGNSFTLDAWIYVSRPWFTLDAEIRYPHRVTLVAIIAGTPVGSFTLDATVAFGFSLDAWIGNAPAIGASGAFQISSFVWRAPWIAPPSPPVFGPTPPPAHQIQILIDGIDMTEHVVWALTSFTQVARTGPGSFTVVLRNEASAVYHGGEEVILLIDGFNTFGGWVMEVNRGFFFPDYPEARLVLNGVDYNILLDKLVMWNKADNPLTSGPYIPIPDFPKGTMDRALVLRASKDWMQIPPRFTIGDGVDEIASPNPDTNGATGNGISFREFMQGISIRTQGIFWWDAYREFQYHDRFTVNAKFGITDNYTGGAGAVGCRDLSITSAADNMVNDDIVWGVMAQTISGEVIYAHDEWAPSQDAHGLWQWTEYRSDVRTQTHVNQRAAVAIDRYANPVVTAICTIFEPGLQAGQVVRLDSEAYGVGYDLVIHQMVVRFTGQTPSGGVMGGVPTFTLSLGLDPEAPWNIYDALPWDQISNIHIPEISFEIPHINFWQGGLPSVWSCEDCTIVMVESFLGKNDGDPWGIPDYSIRPDQPWSGPGTVQNQQGILNGSMTFALDATPPPACIFGMLEWQNASGGSVTYRYGGSYVGISQSGAVTAYLAGFGAFTGYSIDPTLISGPFLFRAYIDQTSISIRVWPTTAQEPTTWTLALSGAGGHSLSGAAFEIDGSGVLVDFIGIALCPGQYNGPPLPPPPDALTWTAHQWISYYGTLTPGLGGTPVPGGSGQSVSVGGALTDQISGSYAWSHGYGYPNYPKPYPYRPGNRDSGQAAMGIPKGVTGISGAGTATIVRPNASYVDAQTVWPVGFVVGRGTYNAAPGPYDIFDLEQVAQGSVIEVTRDSFDTGQGTPPAPFPPVDFTFGDIGPDSPDRDWLPIGARMVTLETVTGYRGFGDVDDSRPDAPYADSFFEFWVGDALLFGGGLVLTVTIDTVQIQFDPGYLTAQFGNVTEWDLVFHRPAEQEGWGCESLSVNASGIVHTSRPFGDGTVTMYDVAGTAITDWTIIDGTHLSVPGKGKGDVITVCYMALRTDQLRSQPRSPKQLSTNTAADKLQFSDRHGKF